MSVGRRLLPLGLICACLLLLDVGPAVGASHCYSNGSGGGGWDDPATWASCAGGSPGSTDDVTIGSGDTVFITAAAAAVHHLTVETGGTLSASSGTLTIGGDWNGTGAFEHNGGTVRFAGDGPQAITSARTGTSKRFHHLVIASEVTAAYSIDLVGDLSVTAAGSLIATSGELEFALSQPATLTCHGDCTFHHLTTRIVDARASTAPVIVNGDFSVVTSSGQFDAPPQLIVHGDWTNNGSFNHHQGQVQFPGSEHQTLAGGGTTRLYDVVVGNPSDAGLLLGQDLRLDGTLTLGDGAGGRVTLGEYGLTLGPGATIMAGEGQTLDADRMIVADGTGRLRREVSEPGLLHFPVGDSFETVEYSPATVIVDAATFADDAAVGLTLVDGKHPANSSPNDYLTRYWSITGEGLSDLTATVRFQYLDNDRVGTEGNLWGGRYDGSWTLLNPVETGGAGSNQFTGTVNSFSDFTGGDATSLPVSLAFFESEQVGNRLWIGWGTTMEAGHVGFNLVRLGTGGRQLLTEALIPAGGGPGPHQYQLELETVLAADDRLLLETVDLFGRVERHGPFAPYQLFGQPIAARPAHEVAPTPVDTRDLPTVSPPLRPVGDTTSPLLQLRIREDGLYRISHEALLAAGYDLSGQPSAALALVNQGEPVAITVGGGPDFGPGAYLEFYGRALSTRYTNVNWYHLYLDPDRARRAVVDERAAAGAATTTYLARRHVAIDQLYEVAAPGPDPWYQARLTAAGAPAEASFSVIADEYQAAVGPVTLAVELWGGTQLPETPDHHVTVAFNGTTVADVTFDGLVTRTLTTTLPVGLLQEGANELTLTLPDDLGVQWDVVGLEGYEVRYPRRLVAETGRLTFDGTGAAFEVTGLTEPEVVVYRQDETGWSRLAGVVVTAEGDSYAALVPGTGSPATYYIAEVGALAAPEVEPVRPAAELVGQPVDYLMITHAEFRAALAPLVAFHQARGLAVRVVDVADVYAQFNDGIDDPMAIQTYLRVAHAEMAVEYVLLVGGDSYDYHDHLGLGNRSFIPTPYGATGEIVRHAPLDPLYADVDGDGVPELKLGRFPVRTVDELEQLIARTTAYADRPDGKTAVFAADTGFAAFSNPLVAQLGDGWAVRPVYLDEMTSAAAHDALRAELEGGVALASFFGHSGPDRWSFEGLLNASEAGSLENGERPALIVQFGCWNNYYVDPEASTMAHQFLLAGDGGAAAVLGASTLTRVSSDLRLGERLMARLARPGMSIGAALADAKAELAAAHPGLVDVQLGYTLLGDPALVPELAAPSVVVAATADVAPQAEQGWLPVAAGLLALLSLRAVVARGRVVISGAAFLTKDDHQ